MTLARAPLLLMALVLVPLHGASPGTAPGETPGDVSQAVLAAATSHGLAAAHPWIQSASDPGAVAAAITRHADKMPEHSVVRARLAYADAEGALRVVASLHERDDALEAFLRENALQAVFLGDDARLVGRVTPDQLASWLSHPAVASVEPDFPLEFLSARSTVTTHGRSTTADGTGVWTYNAASRRLESDIPGLDAITGRGVAVAVIDGGIDRTHPDFFEWGCDPLPVDPAAHGITLDAMPQEVNDALGREAPCRSRIDAAVVVSPLAHVGGYAGVETAQPTDLGEGGSLPSTESAYSHGTHVAGIVAGSAHVAREHGGSYGAGGDNRPFGIAPEARIVSVSMGSGDEAIVPSNLNTNAFHAPWYTAAIAAMQWTLDHAETYGIRVVLNAWTCREGNTAGAAGSCRGGADAANVVPAYARVVEALHAANIVTVTPVGNGGADATKFSIFAQNPHVVAVGATEVTGRQPARWTALGLDEALPDPEAWRPAHETAGSQRPDIVAPGVNNAHSVAANELGLWAARSLLGGKLPDPGGPVTSSTTYVGRAVAGQDPYVDMKGTSVAAAHVAGAVALLFDACPKTSALDGMRALFAGANGTAVRDGGDPTGPTRVGHGLLDVRAALDWLLDSGRCVGSEENLIPAVTTPLDLHGRFPVRVGESLWLRLGVEDPDGAIAGWEIDWGDGSSDAGAPGTSAAMLDESHQYGSSGDHTIRINVSDDAGGLLHVRQAVYIMPPQTLVESPILIDGDGGVPEGAWDEGVQAHVVEGLEIPFNPTTSGAALRIADTTLPIVVRNVTIVVDATAIDGPRDDDLDPEASVDDAVLQDPEAFTSDMASDASASLAQAPGALNESVSRASQTADRLGDSEEDPNLASRMQREVNDAPQSVPHALEPVTAIPGDLARPVTDGVQVHPPKVWSNAPRVQEDGALESYGVWIHNASNVRLENVVVCQRVPQESPTEPQAADAPAAAFLVEASSGVALVRVHACDSGDGLRITTSHAVAVSDCRMWDNRDGARLLGSHNNTIRGCHLEDNARNGLRIEDASRDNSIFDNALRGNAGDDAFDGGQENQWSSIPAAGTNIARGPVVAGNLWGDDGTDLTCQSAQDEEEHCPRGNGPDGISDAPRTIPGGAVDLFPLVPWTHPRAAFEVLVGGEPVPHGLHGPGKILFAPGNSLAFADRSSDPDGVIRQWIWEFPGGWSSDHHATDQDNPLLVNPSATPPLAWGVYPLSLHVVDNTGADHTHTATLLADHVPQITSFAAQPKTGFKVDVQATVSDPDLGAQAEALTLSWDCGPGTFQAGNDDGGTCNYHPDDGGPGSGTYVITLTVTDVLGATVEASQNATVVAASAPNADFAMDPPEPFTLTEVRFIDGTQDDNPETWVWDFGDPGSSDNQHTVTIDQIHAACPGGIDISDPGDPGFCALRHPVHNYTQDGTYEVTLTVTDGIGLSDETSRGITIHNRPPEPEPSHGVTAGDPVNRITFTTGSYDLDGHIQVWSWDFGDPGATDDVYTVTRQQVLDACGGVDPTCPLLRPAYAYARVATYTARLSVTDDDGDTAFADLPIEITTTPPEADFNWSWSGGGEGGEPPTTQDTIHFDGSASFDPDHDPPNHSDPVVKWSWDFGDGSKSDLQLVEHRFEKGGTYVVTLVVEDSHRARSQVLSKQVQVRNVAPVAAFSFHPPNPTTTDEVRFTDESGDVDGTIEGWAWGFGEASTSDQRHPVHTYHPAEPGTYTVTLTATDDQGQTHHASVDVLVRDTPPQVGLSWATEGGSAVTQVPVHFSGSADDPDGDDDALQWQWDLGDGTSSREKNPTHAYARGGDHKVRLIVTDERDSKSSSSTWIHVQNRAPVIDFAIDPPEPMLDQPIRFLGSAEDPEGAGILSWSWNFGDGAAASTPSPTHAFTSLGRYPVSLMVIDADGAKATTMQWVEVKNRLPTASFLVDDPTPLTQATVNFTAGAGDVDGTIVAWEWNFGDGGRSSRPAPTHTYGDDGRYMVTLTVTDDAGDTNRSHQIIDVRNRAPTPIIDLDPPTPTVAEEIRFLAAALDPDGHVVSWHWDFGDGNTSTQQNPPHQYAGTGAYSVVLTAKDEDGAHGTATVTVHVENKASAAGFDHDVQGSTVRFRSHPGGNGTHHAWDFGDGNASSEAEPQHQYARKGAYVVTLQVTEDDSIVFSTTSVVVLDGSDASSGPSDAETRKAPAPPAWLLSALLPLGAFVLRCWRRL